MLLCFLPVVPAAVLTASFRLSWPTSVVLLAAVLTSYTLSLRALWRRTAYRCLIWAVLDFGEEDHSRGGPLRRLLLRPAEEVPFLFATIVGFGFADKWYATLYAMLDATMRSDGG